MSLETDLIAAGVPVHVYETDLYAKDTPEAREVLARHDRKIDGWTARFFRSEIGDKSMWIDIAFGADDRRPTTKP